MFKKARVAVLAILLHFCISMLATFIRAQLSFAAVGLVAYTSCPHWVSSRVGEYFLGGQSFTTELSAFAQTSPSSPANVLACPPWD
jgi:hypothetical protein